MYVRIYLFYLRGDFIPPIEQFFAVFDGVPMQEAYRVIKSCVK